MALLRLLLRLALLQLLAAPAQEFAPVSHP
jgi:hypothetical protein